MTRPLMSRRVADFGETVFATYTRLALKHHAINLGQGFPDFDPPDFVVAAYREAAAGYHQYAPLPGMPELLGALSRRYEARLGQALEPQVNTLVTVGATEALFAAAQALLDPGDEVVIFEPFYDAYPASVTMAGGVPRYVPLVPQADGRWRYDPQALRAAFSARTKLILLNTPHNPTGKVFTAAELDEIIALADEHDTYIMSDEVYEHLVYTPASHLSPAARPGGFARTLLISSIGKTFSVTGWKVGWAVGPRDLVAAVRAAHQWIPFVVASPLQTAAARILGVADAPGHPYYAALARDFQGKRDRLMAALEAAGFAPLPPESGYFVMADAGALGYPDDVALCRDLPARAGVAAIPPSAFYSAPHRALASRLVRFAFCKAEATLSAAGDRLQRLETGWQ